MSDNRSDLLTPLYSPRIVDLFAGPGGLDVAATWLGVESVGIELDRSACATREAAGLQYINCDVRDIDALEFLDCNVLAGGPPCQTFTVAGNGAGRRQLDLVLHLVRLLGQGRSGEVKALLSEMDDERTGLVLQPLIWALKRAAFDEPFEAIVLEQVPAVLPVWQAMAEVLRKRGYGVKCDVLYTEEYGVPQTRRRAVMVARYGIPDRLVALPAATHDRFDRRRPVMGQNVKSMGEVLPELGEFTVVSNYGSGGVSTARGRRKSSAPSFTVTGKISRNRVVLDDGSELRFTPDQAGRLQTFPPKFPWQGRDIPQQIGNAVPPVLAVHVLAAVFGWSDARRDLALEAVGCDWVRNLAGDSRAAQEQQFVLA